MNKQELIKAVAAASGLCVVDASKEMSAFENILEDCMARGKYSRGLAWAPSACGNTRLARDATRSRGWG